ncbi:hypothetical protein SH661x_001238 [Planctomicrobium sp. SH661]|uniref:hypothetical protein n=1 Tax=Planctomicrobium sp. SH661 TaxID=3448124 RepID=UPI003F5B7274
MAKKSWESDFRAEAILASLQVMKEIPREKIFEVRRSFCLPGAAQPVRGWTAGRVSLLFLAAGFTILCMGVTLVSLPAHLKQGQMGNLITEVAFLCTLTAVLLLLTPLVFSQRIYGFLIGDSARLLVQHLTGGPVFPADLNPPGGMSGVNIDSQDDVLVLFDESERHILIAGRGANYQICAEDAVLVETFQLVSNLGVRLHYRIDPQTHLAIVLSRTSALAETIRQQPWLFFLKRFVPNTLYANALQALQPDVPASPVTSFRS